MGLGYSHSVHPKSLGRASDTSCKIKETYEAIWTYCFNCHFIYESFVAKYLLIVVEVVSDNRSFLLPNSINESIKVMHFTTFFISFEVS